MYKKIHRYIGTKIRRYVYTWLYILHRYLDTQMLIYIDTKETKKHIHRYVDTQTHRYIDKQIHKN